MPPKRSTREQDSTPGPFIVSNAMPGDGRPHMFKYSSMTGVAGALQMKNMSSGFMKEDRHTYWNRRPANVDAVMANLKAKRRKLYQKGPEDINGDENDQNGDTTMEAGKLEDVEDKLADAQTKAEQDQEDDNDESDNSNDSDDSAAAERKSNLKGKGRDNSRGNLPDPAKVLIVHPGSRTLRIGRSTDAAPLDIPYCIARKMAKEALPATEPPFSSASSEPLDEMKLENLRWDLKARMRVLNLRGTTAGSIAAAEYNSTVKPQPVADEEDEDRIAWTEVPESSAPEAYFGEEALHLPNPVSHGYKLRYPYRKGTFNTRDYSSIEELLGDIVDIWTYALDKLGIRALDAEQYSVMLLIPDRYAEVYVRNMCELVLQTMGFAQMLVHQEGLSASFAAGLPSACIIDLGAAKISVSCVDEGFVINDTRMVQGYGGDDVTELFLQVVKTVNFPYKEANLAREYDWELCRRLIEQCCAFNEHNFGVNTFEFLVRRPGQQTFRYNMKLHDEVTLPTYCVWVPRMLDWERKLQPQPLLWSERKNIEDPIDIGGDAITGAMKQSVAHLEQPKIPRAEKISASLAIPDATAPATSPAGTPNADTKPTSEELNGASPAPGQQTATTAAKAQEQANGDEEEEDTGPSIDYVAESSKLPLEIAVLESLAQCGSEDRLKRVITNILLVGGLGNMQGVGFALQSRLERSFRDRFPGMPSPLVIPKAKYADSAHLAWRGLINLCRLEVCNDMWIRKDDWELMNLRALRDRSYFVLP